MRKIVDSDQDLSPKLRNSYSGHLDLKPLRDFCREYGERIELPRRTLFQRAGERDVRIAYIERGGVCYLGAADNGRRQVVGFGFEGGFAVDWQAFVRRSNGMMDIETIEASTLLTVDSDRFSEFMDCNLQLRCCISEALLTGISDNMLGLYLLSPEQRFLKVMERYPGLPNRMSMTEIASFIGIEPESLSRIRRRLCSR